MDSIREFAREVAPLYIHNNWLGLGSATLNEAVARVYKIGTELFASVVAMEGDADHTFATTGRVIVERYRWDDEPDEISLGLNLRTMIQDSDGQFYDLFDDRFDVD